MINRGEFVDINGQPGVLTTGPSGALRWAPATTARDHQRQLIVYAIADQPLHWQNGGIAVYVRTGTLRHMSHPPAAGRSGDARLASKLVVMERRRLGRIGHDSSVLIYGGAALSDVTQEVATASIDEALAAGINHFDTAAGYGDSELRFGAVMHRLRDQIFLATKTGERDREAAWRQINTSLERLQTDHVDLLQLHAIGDLTELDAATGADGALHAAIRAQEEGLVAAIGITGHGLEAPATHLEALKRYPFATVLTPLNPVLARDQGYLNSYEALVDEIEYQDAGLMIIKTVAKQNWPDPDVKTYTTWYEPFDQQHQITAAVAWVLAHPEVTGLATPSDVRLLSLVIQAEQERHTLDSEAAEGVLSAEPVYSSPFINMPF